MAIVGEYPNIIVDGQIADAAPVMANFEWVRSEVNANAGGGGGGGTSTSEWAIDGATPTWINGNTFSLPGDRTDIYHIGRRLQLTQGSGFNYGTVSAVGFSTDTTIGFQGDAQMLIDNGLSAVAYGILDSQTPSVPAATNSAIYVLCFSVTGLSSASVTVVGNAASGAGIQTDILGEFNTGSGVFVAREYGWYLMNAIWQPIKNGATISGTSLVQLERDNVPFANSNLCSAVATTDAPVAQCTAIIGCDPGQTLRATVVATFSGGPVQYGTSTITIARIS